jgi:acyl-CoA thioesterase
VNAPLPHESSALPPSTSTLSPEEAQALAQRCADAMFARDRASQALGMRIVRVAPGFAELTMTIRADMLNGHATCHGGFIFSLADSAFAFACNSHNHVTVAAGCTIEFLAPAREGDVLTATGRERALAGRSGVYDIDVNNQHGATIAVFRGKSARIKGHVVAAPDDHAA